jgi:hypothetical protein
MSTPQYRLSLLGTEVRLKVMKPKIITGNSMVGDLVTAK